jgi:hypothetical protein
MLRSTDPVFQTGVQELTAGGWVSRDRGVHTAEYKFLDAFSVDWTYDTMSTRIFVASNQDPTQTFIYVLDSSTFANLGVLGLPGTWRDGPGIAKMADHTMLPRATCQTVDFAIAKGDSTDPNQLDVASWDLSLSEGVFHLPSRLCPVLPVTSCMITQASCPNHPSEVGTFSDDYEGAGSNPAECMQRAYDYYSWCGISPLSRKTTTASYYSNGSVVQSTTVGSSTPPPVVPVYRFFDANTDAHFFSLSSTEGTSAGFTAEGVGFSVFGVSIAGSAPLYRCLIPDFKHFVSLDPACEGQTTEGSYGYVTSAPFSNSSALYRMYNSAILDHLVTTNPQEGLDNGYQTESILGYVP